MGVRAALSEKPAVTSAVTIVFTVLALGAIIFEIRSFSGAKANPPAKRYFTTDDGATYFVEDAHMIPPFTHDGKVALSAFVFKGESGKPWVQYVGRYRPKAKAHLEEMAQNIKGAAGEVAFLSALNEGLEIKPILVGDKGWTDALSENGGKVSEVHPPPGAGIYEEAYP